MYSCTLYPVLCTPAPCTLYSCTLYPVLCTLFFRSSCTLFFRSSCTLFFRYSVLPVLCSSGTLCFRYSVLPVLYASGTLLFRYSVLPVTVLPVTVLPVTVLPVTVLPVPWLPVPLVTGSLVTGSLGYRFPWLPVSWLPVPLLPGYLVTRIPCYPDPLLPVIDVIDSYWLLPGPGASKLSNTTWLSPVANWPQLATPFRPHSSRLSFLRQLDVMVRPPLPCRSNPATFSNNILLFTVVFNGASFITGRFQR